MERDGLRPQEIPDGGSAEECPAVFLLGTWRRGAWVTLTHLLAALFVAACFVVTAHVGRRMPYSGDDMMNLYFAWTKTPFQLLAENLTFAAGRRPLGAAIYRAQFALWGFRSQPLHGVVWVALALNLWLAWRLFRRLGANADAALFGVAIFALHGGLRDLSYNAGTLYDTFCFTFYVSALLVYLRARAQGTPGWRSLLLFTVLFACALNAKEMAASMPLILLLWELVFHPPESWSLREPASAQAAGRGVKRMTNLGEVAAPGESVVRDLKRRATGEWRGIVLSGGLVLIFSGLALSSGSAVHGLIGYTPSWTWRRWVETTAEYLSITFYGLRPAGPAAIALYATAIVAAIGSVVVRAKSFAAFAILWFPITLLPISFVTPRVSGYVLNIPLLLWALLGGMFVGIFLDYAGKRLLSSRRWLGVPRILLLITIAVVFGALNSFGPHDGPHDPPRIETSPVERTARQFKELYPNLKRPVRLLFLHDAFQPDNFDLLFTIRLLYSDPSIEVHRLSAPDVQHPPLGSLPHYDHIFDYRDFHYIELDNSDTQRAIATRLPLGQSMGEYMSTGEPYIGQYIVRDVLDGTGGWRWTGADPEFQFQLKGTHHRKLAARIVIVADTLRQSGPKEITWFVNAHELARRRYEREGENRVSFDVPQSWLSTEGLATVGMHIDPPYVAEDGVKLGVLMMEIGFR
ncbi:MAG TPA: glycosyltransferase family 39 protein [Bryobacteraceae bacterium]